MNKKCSLKITIGMLAGGLLFTLPGAPSFAATASEDAVLAESLNPEGANPHMDAAPRTRITLEQKEAAAAARKQKQVEIEARKKAREAGTDAQKMDEDNVQSPASEITNQ